MSEFNTFHLDVKEYEFQESLIVTNNRTMKKKPNKAQHVCVYFTLQRKLDILLSQPYTFGVEPQLNQLRSEGTWNNAYSELS